MHWDQINPELHAEALQIGVKTKLDISQRLFREKGASDRKSVCFSFNNSGKCLCFAEGRV
jgi:ribose 1,5-bisphosphokinase PhnN